VYIIILFIFTGIRGGLVQASKRYAKANNTKTPGYDETKDKSWIVYQDCEYIFFQNLLIFFLLNNIFYR